MSTSITLPDNLVETLQATADRQQKSLVELIIEILESVLEDEANDYQMLEAVVAEIQATAPNPANFHPATQSLAEQLMKLPDDPDFDITAWSQEWARVEAEMKAISF